MSGPVEAGWLRVEKVEDSKYDHTAPGGLRGESECKCIVLAQETGARAVFTSCKKARAAVEASGIVAVGTWGLLVRAAVERF